VVLAFVTVIAVALAARGRSTARRTAARPPRGLPAPAAPLGAAESGAFGANVYSATGAGMLSPAVADVPYRLYVPNSDAGTVDVIDPLTSRIVEHFVVGVNPQHVVPAWDLRTLYVANDRSNSLTPLDPRTARPAGPPIPVDDPYNLYFIPDGSQAVVVAEARQRLDFRDPHTFALHRSVPVACSGIDHADFSADGTYFIASCEFSGQLAKVDVATETVVGYLHVGGKPQDVRVDPTGRFFFVADMARGGVHEVDGDSFTEVGFLPTGPEAHGLYPSRDGSQLYVSNRGGKANQGSVSVIDFATRRVVATWPIAHGTPDMGGVSPDGKVLWLSGRRSEEVYGIDTTSGRLLARIRVGRGPHGLCVWPQPGRLSLGHTGNMR
jgi:DNA-binding beta-propeller fold protein YncE